MGLKKVKKKSWNQQNCNFHWVFTISLQYYAGWPFYSSWARIWQFAWICLQNWVLEPLSKALRGKNPEATTSDVSWDLRLWSHCQGPLRSRGGVWVVAWTLEWLLLHFCEMTSFNGIFYPLGKGHQCEAKKGRFLYLTNAGILYFAEQVEVV